MADAEEQNAPTLVAGADETEEQLTLAEEEEEDETEEAEEQFGDEEDVESEAEEDPFERMDDADQDDEAQQSMYNEYLELIKEIEQQNACIANLKSRAQLLREKACKTREERREYLSLLVAEEQENLKQSQMLNRAVYLQNFGAKRLYGELVIAITDAEENSFEAAVQGRNKGHIKTLSPGAGNVAGSRRSGCS